MLVKTISKINSATTPSGILLKLLAAVALTELLIMAILNLFHAETRMSHAVIMLIDAAVLSVATALALFYWVIKPMKLFAESKQTEEATLQAPASVANSIALGIDRKQNEEQSSKLFNDVLRAKKEWEMTFDSASELILLVDKELDVIRCNKSFADFAGIPLKEIIGHKCYEFFPCGTEQIEFCKNGNIEEPSEGTEVKTDAGYWLYASHRPVYDEKNKFKHSVIIATDITDIKNAQRVLMESEKELRNKVAELERFYEMAVGRELKMKELKEEIKRLNSELSKYAKNDVR